jgi:hypothetical protein
VIDRITGAFHPVKIHIKEKKDQFERFGAQWTPTILVMDADGTERHRLEGFLPVPDFLAQIDLGLARALFDAGKMEEAARAFAAVAEAHPGTDAAPEAIYWGAVAAYKASGKPDSLGVAARRLKDQYPQSAWAKKSSVWLA